MKEKKCNHSQNTNTSKMKILTDNRYNGTLERKIAVVINQNFVASETDGDYICAKKSMDAIVEELARAVRRFQSESISDNFS